MLRELVAQCWANLRRNRTRSLLTMLGIVWGIVAVAVLLAYGSGFRGVLMHGFDAFGKARWWLGRARRASRRAGRGPAAACGSRRRTATRPPRGDDGQEPEPGDDAAGGRSPTASGWPTRRSAAWSRSTGRSATRSRATGGGSARRTSLERRRVVFLGARLREKLFAGRPAVGETVRIEGMRFTVIGRHGPQDPDEQLLHERRRVRLHPLHAAGDLWDTRYASVLVFSAVAPSLEQARRAGARRSRSGSASRPPTGGPS